MKKLYDFYDRHHYTIILILTIVISIICFAFFYQAGLITAYGDSKGHLNIARRVVDSITPGAAQFGGYWLPLLHILMLPTIWIDFFWHTGLSGTIPNMFAFICGAFVIYKLIFDITKSKISATIAWFIFAANGNMLYMQTAPMTEMLFIGTLALGIYFFYQWVAKKNLVHLIFAAFFFALTSFNRYEGWFVVIFATGVLVIDWLTKRFDKRSEAQLILFSLVAWLGIGSWLLWGIIIFHDPFEFLHNDLSATHQTDVNLTVGYHDILKAVLVNIYAVLHTSGIILTSLLAVGVVIYLISHYRSFFKKEFAFVFILFAPILFDIFTVYTGNIPIEVPEFSKLPYPSNIFNIRYALYSVPAIAVFIGLMVKNRALQIFLFFLVAANYLLMAPFNGKPLFTLEDVSSRSNQEMGKQVVWFKQNYHFDGKVLISTGSGDGFMHDVGIPLENYITEGTYKIWDDSMQNPAKHAEWVIFAEHNPRDQVSKSINKSKMYQDYAVQYKVGDWMALKRK